MRRGFDKRVVGYLIRMVNRDVKIKERQIALLKPRPGNPEQGIPPQSSVHVENLRKTKQEHLDFKLAVLEDLREWEKSL